MPGFPLQRLYAIAGAARGALDAAPAGGPYSFANAEAEAVVARMTSEPDDARKAVIDTFVGDLKAGGVWAKMDVLYVLAAHASQAALLDWKNLGGAEAFNATETVAPVFTADRGYAGDFDDGSKVSSAYGTASGAAAQDDGHIAAFVVSTNADAITFDAAMGTRDGVMGGSTGTDCRGRWARSIGSSTGPTGGGKEHVVAVRRDSAEYFVFRNGVSSAAVTNTSGARSGTLVVANTERQSAVVSVGTQLSDAEVLAYYEAARDYLIALGVTGL